MRSYLVYINLCRDLVFGVVRSILLRTLRSDIFGSFSSLTVVADGRVLVICYNSLSLLDFLTEGRDFDCLPQLR